MMDKMNNRENIYSLKGFSKVFRFTTGQTLKNKAYRASFIIIVLVMTFVGPLQYVAQNSSQEAAVSGLVFQPEDADTEKVFIVNETAVELAVEDVEEMYADGDETDRTAEESAEDDSASDENSTSGIDKSDIVITNGGEAPEKVLDQLGKRDSAVVITEDETGFHVKGIIADDSEVKVDEIDTLAEIVREAYDKKRLATANISEGDISLLTSGIQMDGTIEENEYLTEQSREINEDGFFMYTMGFAMIMFIVISMSSGFIITSVTEEKQSKLVESLLVSVRPMALLMGKICGMMAYVVLILICGMIGSNVSNFVMQNVMHITRDEFSEAGFDFSMFVDFGGIGTIAMLVSIVIGFATFGILAGMFGSSCNKTEDIQNATSSVMMISMVGYVASSFVAGLDKDIISLIGGLLPPFSYYVAPVAYVTGRISLPVLLGAYALQIILLILLLRLSAKAYRNLLFSDASTPKLKTILKSAKG